MGGKNSKPEVNYYRVSHGASFGADQELLARVNESPHFHPEANLNNCQIIFVFCTINTRIESDMKAAMEKIPESAGDKPVILVVMHHTRDINFTTTRKKWKEKYERVQLDVEVLFHRSEGGLLRCEKNQQAVEEIRKKIQHIRNKVEQKRWEDGEKRGTERGGKEERKEETGGTEERVEGGGVKEKGGHESSRRRTENSPLSFVWNTSNLQTDTGTRPHFVSS